MQNTNNFENLQKLVPNKDTPFCRELPLVVDSLCLISCRQTQKKKDVNVLSEHIERPV